MRGALRRLTARPVPLPVPSHLPHPFGVPPQVVRPLEPAWEAAYRAWQAEWNAWRTRSLPEAFARPAMLAPEPDNPAHHVDVADPRFRTTRADETGDRTSMHRQVGAAAAAAAPPLRAVRPTDTGHASRPRSWRRWCTWW